MGLSSCSSTLCFPESKAPCKASLSLTVFPFSSHSFFHLLQLNASALHSVEPVLPRSTSGLRPWLLNDCSKLPAAFDAVGRTLCCRGRCVGLHDRTLLGFLLLYVSPLSQSASVPELLWWLLRYLLGGSQQASLMSWMCAMEDAKESNQTPGCSARTSRGCDID